MPRGKRAGSKMPTADYDAGCPVRSTSTKCQTRKSRTSSSPPISRPENAWASRLLFRQSSKSLAKTCKSGSRKALLHLALESREPSRPLMWPIWLYLSDDDKRDRLPAALRPTSAMLAYSAKGAFCRKSTDEGGVYPGMNFNPKSAMKLSLVVFGWFLAMPQMHVVN
jgi:hypothetical protein